MDHMEDQTFAAIRLARRIIGELELYPGPNPHHRDVARVAEYILMITGRQKLSTILDGV